MSFRYAQIRRMDIVNGVGIACSLFVQGCNNHCEGCFNQETWDFNGGQEWTPEIEETFIKLCKNSHVKCISILGGEPLQQNDSFYWTLKRIKEAVGKPIFLWTGYVWEQIPDHDIAWDIVRECVDVLIDGRFDKSKRDLTLHLRGSSNQRVIDVKKSLTQNEIVLYK